MDPLSIAGVALGGLQTIAGLFSSPKERPKWEIPSAIKESVSTARQMASSTVRPGNQIALDQISKASARAVSRINRTAGSGSQALAAADRVAASEMDAVTRNNAMNADFSFNAKRNLQGVLATLAGYQREQFVKNVWEPYQEQRQTSAALIGSGIQNVFGQLQGAASNKLMRDYLGVASPTRPRSASTGAAASGGGNFNPDNQEPV